MHKANSPLRPSFALCMLFECCGTYETGKPPGHSYKVSSQPCQSRKGRYRYTGLRGCYCRAAAQRTNHRVTNQGNSALLVFSRKNRGIGALGMLQKEAVLSQIQYSMQNLLCVKAKMHALSFVSTSIFRILTSLFLPSSRPARP